MAELTKLTQAVTDTGTADQNLATSVQALVAAYQSEPSQAQIDQLTAIVTGQTAAKAALKQTVDDVLAAPPPPPPPAAQRK